MRDDIIRKTGAFIRCELLKSAEYPGSTRRMAEYRIEHSFRVAHIAAEIAEKEGFDRERSYVAGLLHDIGYSTDLKTEDDHRNHGRIGAAIARAFLPELGYSDREIAEICFGIAIHVDDNADFEGERTPLALTVQDADNIDRFDAYRLYEGLSDADFRDLPLPEQRDFAVKRLERLKRLREVPFGTETAAGMWRDRIDFQTDFFTRLLRQISDSE